MVFKFLRNLVSPASSAPRQAPQEASVEYNGHTIVPTPRQEGGVWRVMGVISKEIDGGAKSHTFVRADTHADEDEAVSPTIAKGDRIIDEQGERLLRDE